MLELLVKLFKQTLKYKPNLICTPECSNIVTHDKKHLFQFATYQNKCPIIKESRIFAKKHKVNINYRFFTISKLKEIEN